MNKQHIQEIIELFEQSSVAKLELEVETFKIKLEKYHANAGIALYEQPLPKPLADSSLSQQSVKTSNEIESSNDKRNSNSNTASEASNCGHIITAPLVGTFYASRQQDGPPFVSVGSKVQQGDVLCIVEAMKVMNEIRADKAGIIKEIKVANEDMVQFKQPLFVLED